MDFHNHALILAMIETLRAKEAERGRRRSSRDYSWRKRREWTFPLNSSSTSTVPIRRTSKTISIR